MAADEGRALGRAYNVAGPPVTQIDYLQLLADIAGRRANLAFIPRDEIQRHGGELFAPPLYFGVYLDIPSITVRIARARAELGLELTPLDEGLRETYRWYQQQERPRPDFSWEDRLLAAR